MAYAVFHSPEVNGRLAPDGGIYHRQQRGGHMDVADAPFVPRSHISAQVANATAAQVDNHMPPVGSALQEGLPHLRRHLEALALLADRHLYELRLLQRLHMGYQQRQTMLECVLVQQDGVAGVAPLLLAQLVSKCPEATIEYFTISFHTHN